MGIAAIQAGITEALDTVGIRSGTDVATLNPPMVAIGLPDRISLADTFEKGITYTIPLLVIVSRASERNAVIQLDALLDPNGNQSVTNALDFVTSTAWSSLSPVEVVDIGDLVVGDVTYLAARIILEVIV